MAGGTTPGAMTLPTTPLQGSLVKNGVSFKFFNLDYKPRHGATLAFFAILLTGGGGQGVKCECETRETRRCECEDGFSTPHPLSRILHSTAGAAG